TPFCRTLAAVADLQGHGAERTCSREYCVALVAASQLMVISAEQANSPVAWICVTTGLNTALLTESARVPHPLIVDSRARELFVRGPHCLLPNVMYLQKSCPRGRGRECSL